MKRIAVIGTINPEIITGPLHDLPDWGTQTRSPATEIVYAGSAARVAFPLRMLGHQVSVFSVVGNDSFGASCLEELQGWGIGVEGIEQINGERTASCVAIVRDDAQRTYISDIDILEKCNDYYLARHVDHFSQCDYVLLTGLFEIAGLTMPGVGALFSSLRAEGVTTLLDTGWHLNGWPKSALDELYLLLQETDYVLPNVDEAVRMVGAEGSPETLLRALRLKGAHNIYLKLGGQGAACLAGEDYFSVDAVPITPVNTTAAGECFNAGVLHGFIEGMSPCETLDFANRLAAHYVATGEYRRPSFQTHQ